jgi:hypothetical protein
MNETRYYLLIGLPYEGIYVNVYNNFQVAEEEYNKELKNDNLSVSLIEGKLLKQSSQVYFTDYEDYEKENAPNNGTQL